MMLLRTFMVSVRGVSHIETEKPCQDAAKVLTLRNRTAGIACVADGHGGSAHFRSQKGAELAVSVSAKVLNAFIRLAPRRLRDGETVFERILVRAEKAIVECWRLEVLRDLADHPFTGEELAYCEKNWISLAGDDNRIRVYGTTLLGAVITKTYWAALQIGDGNCVIITEKGAEQAVPSDPDCGMGLTTSLCSGRAVELFRHNFGSGPVLGLTAASDGVSDSFIPEYYLEFNSRLLNDFVARPALAEQELRSYLPELSAQGSRDDASIAGVFNITQAAKVLRRQKL
jgi:hypothetical protein